MGGYPAMAVAVVICFPFQFCLFISHFQTSEERHTDLKLFTCNSGDCHSQCQVTS